jgi:hypothetical protein
VLKPKIAASWDLFEGLKLRGSCRKLPRTEPAAILLGGDAGIEHSHDYAFCRVNTPVTNPCAGVSTLEVRAGNRGLRPEEATNMTAGHRAAAAAYPRSAADGRHLADPFDRRLGIQGAQNQLNFDFSCALAGSSNPNVVRLAPAGGPDRGSALVRAGQLFQPGPRTIKGIDLELQ